MSSVYYLSESATRYHVSTDCAVIQQSSNDPVEVSRRDAELKGFVECADCPKPVVGGQTSE